MQVSKRLLQKIPPAQQAVLHKNRLELHTGHLNRGYQQMLKFTRNMNMIDRSVRILVGSSLLIVGPLTNLIETDMMSNIILGTLGWLVGRLSAVMSLLRCERYDLSYSYYE